MKRITKLLLVLYLVLSIGAVCAFAAVEETDVAKIGDTGYATLQEAINAANEGDTVELLTNVDLAETITVASDDKITLDLAGYTISYNPANAKTTHALANSGDLTIMDSSDAGTGKITSEAANPDTAEIPGYASNTIVNGGTLTLNSGTIECTTASGGACYAIDTMWYSNSSKAPTVIINGGKVKAVATAIRMIGYATEVSNNLTINGGEIEGTRRAIWVHLPANNNEEAPLVNLNINGGTITAGSELALYVYSYGNAYNGVAVDISGGTITGAVAMGGGSSNGGSGADKLTISGGTFLSNAYSEGYSCVWWYNDKFDISISGGLFQGEISAECLVAGLYSYKISQGDNADWYAVRGHNNVVFVAAENATCTEPGKVEHWYCQDDGCGKAFADQACLNELATLETGEPAGHSYDLDQNGDPCLYVADYTECGGGVKADYYWCYVCMKAFDQQGQELEIRERSQTGHTPILENKLEADWFPCTGGYKVDRYLCSVCGTDCDADGNRPVWVDGDGNGHDLGETHLAEDEVHYCSGWYAEDYSLCTICGGAFVVESEFLRPPTVYYPAYNEELVHVPGAEKYDANFVECGGGYKVDHYYCEYCCRSCDKDGNAVEYADGTNTGHTPFLPLKFDAFQHCYGWAVTEDYYYCLECLNYCHANGDGWKDEAVDEFDHTYVLKHAEDEQKNSCRGWYEEDYYECSTCGSVCAVGEDGQPDETKYPLSWTYQPDADLRIHDLIHYPAFTTADNEEFWFCADCASIFADAEGKEFFEDLYALIHQHKLTHTDAKAPTCTEKGNVAYDTCSACEMNFDADGKELTTVEVAALGHKAEEDDGDCTTAVHCTVCKEEVEAAASAHTGGTATCEKKAVCEACGKEYGELAEHKLTKVDAKDATCTEKGNVAYYVCSVCKKNVDADGKELTTVEVAALGHKAEEDDGDCTTAVYCTVCKEEVEAAASVHTGGTATCEKKAVCEVCGKEYGELAEHKLTKVDAKAATYTAAGNIEHYVCTCGKLFADDKGEKEITDAVIPRLVKVEEEKAEISEAAVDNAITEAAKSENTTNIVLDMNEIAEGDAAAGEKPAEVTKVELPVTSLEKVAELHEDATLTVALNDATVVLDTTAMEAIAAQAKGETVTLNISNIETAELNEKQQEALEDKKVAAAISAEIICNTSNEKIADFQGGNVTVEIPFAPEEGTHGSEYTVFYVADDGTMEEIETAYVDGKLVVTLKHFSEYVVVHTAQTSETPDTGDQFLLIPAAALVLLSAAGCAVMIGGKKKLYL